MEGFAAEQQALADPALSGEFYGVGRGAGDERKGRGPAFESRSEAEVGMGNAGRIFEQGRTARGGFETRDT